MRRALAEVFARPEYRWAARRHPLEWLVELWHRFNDWLDTFQRANPRLFDVALVVLVVVLIGLLVHIGYVVWRITRPAVRPGPAASGGREPVEDARAHAARAEELAGEGRYAEALAHRFAAVVLELERRRALAFRPSKTPAEYLSEARLDAAGRASLAELVARLYRHLFGALPCDERTYREFGLTAGQVLQHVLPD